MSEDHKKINLARYDANAQRLALSYDSVETPDCLPVLTQLVKGYKKECRVALDIGCGSGRDAYWLCEHGWKVVAADGSRKMLNEAMNLHQHDSLTYIHDTAPGFLNVAAMGRKYNLIVMAAFIFHFDAPEREAILKNAAALLENDGLVHITLRHGPPSLDRTIFDVSGDEIIAFAKAHNFDMRVHGVQPDFLGRTEITWTHVSFWRGEAWSHARHTGLEKTA